MEDLAFLPVELLSQHGVLRWLPREVFEVLLREPFALGLRGLLTVGLVWLIMGGPGYRGVAVGVTLFDGLGKSLGHINHANFAMLYAAWILAAFPAADGATWFARPTRRGRQQSPAAYAAPMVAIALVICTAYMFVGAHRLDATGLEIFRSDTLKFWFIRRNLEHNPTGFTLDLWIAAQPQLMLMAQLGFAVGTLMEILSPLCLFYRSFRLLWAPAMVVFHFANFFTMNIDFWQNSLLVLFFVTDVDRVLAPGLHTRRFRRRAGVG